MLIIIPFFSLKAINASISHQQVNIHSKPDNRTHTKINAAIVNYYNNYYTKTIMQYSVNQHDVSPILLILSLQCTINAGNQGTFRFHLVFLFQSIIHTIIRFVIVSLQSVVNALLSSWISKDF